MQLGTFGGESLQDGPSQTAAANDQHDMVALIQEIVIEAASIPNEVIPFKQFYMSKTTTLSHTRFHVTLISIRFCSVTCS